MNRLTKTLTTLSLAVVLALPFAGLASAATKYWKVDISTPATQSSRTFNVQYTTLSTQSTDVIDVDLYQNGAMIDSQTTIPAGDSGAFAVTVPIEGTYSYYIVADNAGDAQTTGTKTVNVVAPPTQVNTVTVNTTDPNAATNGGVNSGTTTGSNNGSTTNGDGQTNGANSQNGSTNGQVDANGNSTDDQNPETLGESKKDDNKNDSKTAWIIIIIAAVVAVLYANRNRFMNRKDK